MHPELERLIKERPDLEPILKFYDLVLEKQEGSRPDDLSPIVDLTEDSIKDSLTNSIPLIDPAKVGLLNLQNSLTLFSKLLGLIKASSPLFGHHSEGIEAGLEGLDMEEPMRSALGGDLEELYRFTDKAGISRDLLCFLIWLSMTPSLRKLSSMVEEKIHPAWWDRPSCPLCGQLPNMVEVEGEGRRLSCSFCFMEWGYTGPECPFCCNKETKMFGTLRIKGEDGYHLSICGNCNGYIKVIDRKHISGELGNQIIDLISLPLDVIARQKGHKRPTLFPL